MHNYVDPELCFRKEKFSDVLIVKYVIESSIYLHRWPVMKNLSGTNL